MTSKNIMETMINFRELGGIKTQDNAVIRMQRLFRSAAPEEGSAHDHEILRELNIGHYVDFREPREKDSEKNSAFNQEFNRLETPVNVGDFFSRERMAALAALPKDAQTAQLIFIQIYERFVTDYQKPFYDLFTCVNQGGKVLFHCSAGKDRTGFAAFLILSALNVHPDDIMENFLASNGYTQVLFNNNQQRAQKLGLDPEFYATFRLVHEVYLQTAIKTIQERYKTVEAFLTHQLKADMEALRTHYLL